MTKIYKGGNCTTALTKEQYRYIIDTYKDNKDYAMLCVSLLLGSRGLRISDVINTLKISDIYDNNGNIKENLVFTEQKTRKKRILPLHNNNETIQFAFNEYYKIISHLDRDRQLFSSPKPGIKSFSASIVKHKLKVFVGKMLIDQISPHSFRKYFGRTLHFEYGYSVEQIAHVFAHSNHLTTMYYLNIGSKDVQNAINSIDF